MNRLLPLCLVLACALPAAQAQDNNCNRLQPCLDRCAKELADCQDTDYICKGENTNCKKSCQGQHQARISTRGKTISQYARDCIWANYPEMQGAIDLINDDVFEGLIDYAMYPSQGYSDPRGIPTSIRKIPREDMGTPHYWLLLKIYEDNYNYYADESGNPGMGVPPPPYPPSGVWFFAKGLRENNPDSESDLLKALYIAAVGDPAPVEAIIDGTFMNVPGVREKVREWREKNQLSSNLDEEEHLLLAYNLNILRKANFRDKELVELSLLALEDFYDEISAPSKSDIYGAETIADLTRRDKLQRYSIIKRTGARSVVTNPLPVLRFAQ